MSADESMRAMFAAQDTQQREQQLRIQALGAAISRRNWHAVELAYNALRDAFDRPEVYDRDSVPPTGSSKPDQN